MHVRILRRGWKGGGGGEWSEESDDLQDNIDLNIDVAKLADKYGLVELKELCESYLCKKAQFRNQRLWAQLSPVADRYK